LKGTFGEVKKKIASDNRLSVPSIHKSNTKAEQRGRKGSAQATLVSQKSHADDTPQLS
jgi:hypothetical protein